MNILSLAPLAGPALEDLRAMGSVEVDPWIEHVPIRLHAAEELIERLRGVDALIVEADFVPAEVLDAADLRLLGVCRGDPNNIDLAAATRNGVAVVRTPGRNATGVAELTVGLMIAALRGIVRADGEIRRGEWVIDQRIAQQRYRGRELGGSAVSLIGFGAVARAVARMLAGFGASVLAYDPFVPAADIQALGVTPQPSVEAAMAAGDIVSVHAPLTPDTVGLVGAAAFDAIRPGAILVNTARYEIVDEEPMLAALRDGRLATAAFDHFHHEFLPPDHPLIQMPQVILTPHIGGATLETVEVHTRQIAEGFAAVLAGRTSATVVNPDVLGV